MKPFSFLLIAAILFFAACNPAGEDAVKVSDAEAEHLFITADSLLDANDYGHAIEKYRQALKIYEKKGDTASISDCYFQLSTAYHRIGDFNLSIDMAKKCLHLDSLSNNPENLSSSYNTLAALFLSAKDLTSAKKFINQAIELERLTDRQDNMSARYGLASEIYTKDHQAERGLDFARQAYQLDSVRKDTANMGKRLSQIGDAYAALQQQKEAEQSYLQAARMLEHTKLANSVCINYKQLGNLYDNMGNRPKAVEFYGKSMEVARKYNLNYLLESDLSRLTALYGEIDPHQGYLFAKEALALKDSIYNEKIQVATQEFSARYDLVTKENKITEQENRIKAQKAWLIIICVIFGLLLLALYYFFRLRFVKREKQFLNVKYYHALTHDFSNEAGEETDDAAIENDVISTTEADRQFILKVDEIIERNLDSSALSSVKISQEICLGQRQLNRKMKAITGSDTGTYIRDKRILKAKKLLKTTDKSIGEIQAVCGFESPSYFSKVFRDVEGVSPSEYRKRT